MATVRPFLSLDSGSTIIQSACFSHFGGASGHCRDAVKYQYNCGPNVCKWRSESGEREGTMTNDAAHAVVFYSCRSPVDATGKRPNIDVYVLRSTGAAAPKHRTRRPASFPLRTTVTHHSILRTPPPIILLPLKSRWSDGRRVTHSD